MDVVTVAPKVAAKLIERLSPFFSSAWTKISVHVQGELKLAFQKSLEQAYLKHSYFSSVVFPNSQLKLVDYYIPLTLKSTIPQGKTQQITITQYPENVIEKRKDLLVVDTAGMGKSTLLKYIFIQAVEHGNRYPIFIELRKLGSEKNSIVNYVTELLKSSYKKLDENLMHGLIEAGHFIFFLDGFDEIEDDSRSAVTSEIQEFKRRANKNSFILSSREMPGLGAFQDFYRYSIRPLDRQEAKSLIRKYASDQKVASSLIEKIDEPQHEPVHEFLSNPLLVSLLYKAYDYKNTLPLRKNVFYRQVFEALFENHDLRKDAGELNRRKKSGLDVHTFEIVMRTLGFETMRENKVEYSKDQILLILERCRTKSAPIDFNPQYLLDDLTLAVPLFTIDGLNYRWQHKSLQEYFAALQISASGIEFQKKVVESMFVSSKADAYENLLGLFADISPKEATIVLGALVSEEIIKAFEQKPLSRDVDAGEARLRKILTFDLHHAFTYVPDFPSGETVDLPAGMVAAQEKISRKLITHSVYQPGNPGHLVAWNARAGFLRTLLVALEGSTPDRFVLKVQKPRPDQEIQKHLPKTFSVDDNTIPKSYFDSINALILGMVLHKDTIFFIDIDEVYKLRESSISLENDLASDCRF